MKPKIKKCCANCEYLIIKADETTWRCSHSGNRGTKLLLPIFSYQANIVYCDRLKYRKDAK